MSLFSEPTDPFFEEPMSHAWRSELLIRLAVAATTMDFGLISVSSGHTMRSSLSGVSGIVSLSDKDFCISNWELWQAIRDASLPGVVSRKHWSGRSRTETFQERLSSKYDLTEESARRLVEEYRRFLYLKAIDGGPLTPSKHVDQAWHLHIEAPGEEWTRFCDEVLKCQIEHQTGLSESKAQASYARLLHLYRREFNHEPPSDIWPGERETRQRAIGIGMISAGFVLFTLGAIFWEPYLGGFGPLAGVAVGLALIILGGAVLKGTDLETVANCA